MAQLPTSSISRWKWGRGAGVREERQGFVVGRRAAAVAGWLGWTLVPRKVDVLKLGDALYKDFAQSVPFGTATSSGTTSNRGPAETPHLFSLYPREWAMSQFFWKPHIGGWGRSPVAAAPVFDVNPQKIK